MHSKHHRLDDCCYVGLQRYFLTFCADWRRPLFRDRTIVASAWQQILRAAGERAFAIIAYIFMPDHTHLLVEGLDATSDLQAFAHLAKQRSSHDYKQATGSRLWQPGYWDRVLRNDESTWDVAHYMCDNPVRKGLVKKWTDYELLRSGIMSREDFIREMTSHPTRKWQPYPSNHSQP